LDGKRRALVDIGETHHKTGFCVSFINFAFLSMVTSYYFKEAEGHCEIIESKEKGFQRCISQSTPQDSCCWQAVLSLFLQYISEPDSQQNLLFKKHSMKTDWVISVK
jgi:hypothetical protein